MAIWLKSPRGWIDMARGARLSGARFAYRIGDVALAELADIVGRRVQWYYRMVAPARGHGSWAEHAEMIDVIEAGDPERAQALARKHTERTREAYHRPRSAS